MKARLLILCVAAILLPPSVPAPAAQRRVARQTEFGMDTPIRRKVRVPGYVLQQMMEAIRRQGYTVTAETVADIASEARGSLVNLDDDGRDDLLVQGDPGANITGFWLFRNAGRRWGLVLYAVAHNLTIKRGLTRGYHDVEVVALSAAKGWGANYEFDGTRYKPAGCWERDLGVGKDGLWGPPKSVECSGSDVKPYR